MTELLIALVMTVLTEGAVILMLTRSWERVQHSLWCNLVTNPTVNLLLLFLRPVLSSPAERAVIAVLEIAVVISEAFLYRAMERDPFSRCFFRSLAANAVSFLSGFLIF